jgi:hypothetical protein
MSRGSILGLLVEGSSVSEPMKSIEDWFSIVNVVMIFQRMGIIVTSHTRNLARLESSYKALKT